MQTKCPITTILWAIDPLAKDRSIQAAVPASIKALTRSQDVKVIPVSVILRDQLPYLAGAKTTESDFSSAIEKDINEWIREFSLRSVSPFKVHLEPEFSVKSAVKRVIDLGEQNQCDFIICTTHAKQRKKQSDLGTFCETLFLLSPGSLFLVPPQAKIPENFTNIFFPTDISTASLSLLERITPVISFLNAHLTIFHKFLNVCKETIELPLGMDVRSRYTNQRQMDETFVLQQIAAKIKEEHISVDLIIDTLNSEYIAKSIIERTKFLKSGFIAMASHSEPVSGSLPGSVTRQVVRNTELPIWILHERKTKETVHGIERT